MSREFPVLKKNSIAQFALTLVYTIFAGVAIGCVIGDKGAASVIAILAIVGIVANLAIDVLLLINLVGNKLDRIRFFVMAGLAGLLFIANIITSDNVSIVGILFSIVALAIALGESELAYSSALKEEQEERTTRPRPAQRTMREFIMDDEEFAATPAPAVAPAPAPFNRPLPAPLAADVAPMNLNGFRVEEYAEAVPYEGGPVEGVEMAEEVNPTFNPNCVPGNVQTAGYDFYNCKSFDPFIATLDMEERNQFTEIFILKFKGVMPEIPDYEVGGDNKEFFRKIFIYLGQYRDRIPSGLLAKMYAFSLKISN